MLPLGGYRPYRPNVVRYDTLLPITLFLIFVFVESSLFVLTKINFKKAYYLFVLSIILIIFTFVDEPKFDNNKCERESLLTISNSPKKTVKLDSDCTVMDWQKAFSPEKTEYHSRLLKLWKITDEKKLFYHARK